MHPQLCVGFDIWPFCSRHVITSEIPLTIVAKCILCWQTSSLNVVSGRLLTSRGIWYSGTCFRSYSTVLCKSFRPPSFCLSHENSYLIQNGSNFKRTFTCVRAKRYLSLVTFKNWYCKPEVQLLTAEVVVTTFSQIHTWTTQINLFVKFLLFQRHSVAKWLQCFRNNKKLWYETWF